MIRLAMRLLRSIKNYTYVNRTIRELNQLSDHELADLGLSRGMIRSVAMESIYDNQTN